MCFYSRVSECITCSSYKLHTCSKLHACSSDMFKTAYMFRMHNLLGFHEIILIGTFLIQLPSEEEGDGET